MQFVNDQGVRVGWPFLAACCPMRSSAYVGPKYFSTTVGGCVSQAKSEVTTLFRAQQTHAEYGSPRHRGALKSPVDDFIVATVTSLMRSTPEEAPLSSHF